MKDPCAWKDHEGAPCPAQVIVTDKKTVLRICLTCAGKPPFEKNKAWRYLKWGPFTVVPNIQGDT